jgi:hypothetical protein
MIALGASAPGGGRFSPTPFLELPVLPGSEMMVLAGEMAGEAFDAFFGGLPSLDGPGPREFRKEGAGVAAMSAVKYAKRTPVRT